MIMHTSVLSWAYLILLFLPDAPEAIWLVLFLPDALEAVWLVFICFRLTLLWLYDMCCLFVYLSSPDASKAKWHSCFIFCLKPLRLYGIDVMCVA